MSSRLIVGNAILKLSAVGSTNSYALDLLKNQNVPEGLVIWALEQSEGRGQMGTIWHSSPGDSLTFSVILTPKFLTADRQFVLNKAISRAVFDYVYAKNIPEVRIKWPNDIYIGEQKAGGILIENSLAGANIQSSVIGIGINLNQSSFMQLPNATSFYQQTLWKYDAEEELNLLLAQLDKWYLKLLRNDIQSIDEAYFDCLYGKDDWKLYRSAGKKFRGKVVGVNKTGLLRLQMEDGEVKEYGFKEIERIPED